MAQYEGNAAAWLDTIYQFEETDPVQGGPTGIDNVPLMNLADRTAWLKANLGLMTFLDGEVILTGSGNVALGANVAGCLLTAWATGIYNLTLPDASTVKHGAIFPITGYANANCVTNILAPAGQPIFDITGGLASLSIHHKEHLFLVALTDHYKVLHAVGNFYQAGEEIKARIELNNTIALRGQLLQRAQYPRLWKFAQQLTMFHELVPEWYWFLDNTTYRGCFTDGDGVSTFRIPDERGTFERMIDLGRGLDVGRGHNFAGGYEADDFKAHTHANGEYDRLLKFDGQNTIAQATDNQANGRQPNIEYQGQMLTVGGLETRPKNTGKLFLIKF